MGARPKETLIRWGSALEHGRQTLFAAEADVRASSDEEGLSRPSLAPRGIRALLLRTGRGTGRFRRVRRRGTGDQFAVGQAFGEVDRVLARHHPVALPICHQDRLGDGREVCGCLEAPAVDGFELGAERGQRDGVCRGLLCVPSTAPGTRARPAGFPLVAGAAVRGRWCGWCWFQLSLSVGIVMTTLPALARPSST